jgi:hypothetical protein
MVNLESAPIEHRARTPVEERDRQLGHDYAVAAVAAMVADGRNLLALIFSDMVRAALERAKSATGNRTRRARFDPVMGGFLFQIGQSMPEIAKYR